MQNEQNFSTAYYQNLLFIGKCTGSLGADRSERSEDKNGTKKS